jgi:hypothetical protein
MVKINTMKSAPVAKVASAASTVAAPKVSTAKKLPVVAKTTAAAVPKVSTAKAAPVVAVEKIAKTPATITRTAATIHAMRANFASLSDRDQAYFAFICTFAGVKRDQTVTIKDIVESKRFPNWAGSKKPHDAGVMERLVKAGLLVEGDAGHSFRFTDKGREHKSAA